MMENYFEEVYLKRMNVDGKTQQERVKTRKEKEFDRLFLKKTEYQVILSRVNDKERNEICSLQPNAWNESNLIGNLLMSTKSEPLRAGDILEIHQQIKDTIYDKIWLVLFVEENITKGYQLFKLICLDSTINLIDEYGSTDYSFPVKIVSATSTFVQDTFIHSATQLGYREPAATRSFITKDFGFLKKTQYFEYKKRGWEIAGIDNLSIEGVAFITISERLKVEPELKSSKDLLVGQDTNFFLNGR